VRLSEREKRVCELIAARADELLADLRRHVNTPTGRGHTPGLDETRAVFTERLEKLGARTTTIPGDPSPHWVSGLGSETSDAPPLPPPTAVCRRTDGRDALQPILIAGHLDTVHDRHSPFRELTIAADGKTATGPGCVDMKGGLVIALAALEALEEAGIDASWSFLMNSDEETGSYASASAIRETASSHAWGLALEPALPGGVLAQERGGSGQFFIECHGRSAHVGRDFASGVSAVTALARALIGVAALSDAASGRVANVGPISGGAVTNAVPDVARAWGNVRYRTPEDAAVLRAGLEALSTAEDAMPRVTVQTSFNRPAKPMNAGTAALVSAAQSAAADLGQTLPTGSTGGVCDGNIMQDAGLATIDTLGVRGGGLHTNEEWIELASLVERCQLLAVLIARLTEGRAETTRA